MTQHLRAVLNKPDLAQALARDGRDTILRRHTCRHRVEELLEFYRDLCPQAASPQTLKTQDVGVSPSFPP